MIPRLGRLAVCLAACVATCWCALLGSAGSGTVGPADPASKPRPEYEIKAGYLFNFTKYVTWPTNTFADEHAPFTIGVLSSPKIAEALDGVAEGRKVDGRPIVIRRLKRASEGRQCQILFLGVSEKEDVRKALDEIGNAPVLMVGDAEGFLDLGGTIRFVRQGNTVGLEIREKAARGAGVVISARLLSVARVIRD